jgi:predicted nucleic acid-binding protein
MFVLDTSVTMSWCFEDERDPYGTRVLDALTAEEALVPHLWQLEVTNVLAVAERQKRIKPATSHRFLELLYSLPITIDTSPPLAHTQQLLTIARQYNLSAYDTAYIELSSRQHLPLASLDKPLNKIAKKIGIKRF